MNQIKLKFVLLILISLHFFEFTNKAVANDKILYGSSAYALPNNIQEFLLSGFLLALKNNYSENEIKSFLIQDQKPGKSPLEPVDIFQSNLKNNPKAIFGFPSTHESQLIGKLADQNKVLTIFASSTNSRLNEIGKYVLSTSENPEFITKKFIEIINKDYSGKKGALIYFPENYFSLDQKNLWTKPLTNYNKPNIDFISIDKVENENTVETLKNYDYLIITSFPTTAFDLISLMNKKKIDLPIFTNSSWYKVNHEILSRLLSQKIKPIYYGDGWDKSNPNSINFIKSFKRTYGITPNIEAAIGYESGFILSELLKRKKYSYTKDFTELLYDNPCFTGGPLGDFCFEKNGGFAKRTISMIKIIRGKKHVLFKTSE